MVFPNLLSPEFWWVIAGIFFIIEMAMPGAIFIFPAFGAVITALFSYITRNPIADVILFVSTTSLSLFLVRPMFLTSRRKELKFGVQALIGKELRVVETINNSLEQGKVKHASDIFPARSTKDEIINKDAYVKIVRIEGITLYVELIQNK